MCTLLCCCEHRIAQSAAAFSPAQHTLQALAFVCTCKVQAWMGVPFAVGFGLVRKQRGQDQSWRQQQHQQQAHQMAAHPGAQGSGQWQAPGEWRQQPAQYPHHAPGPYQQHMHQPPQPPPPVYQPSYDYEAGQPAAAPPAGWQNGHNAHQSTHSSHGSWQYGAAGQKGGDEAAGGAKV